jgi:hypothetical protein
MLIWGALDLYCDEHDGPPESLDALVPNFLRELPSDPFATAESIAEEQKPGGYTPSKKGAGYHYLKGSSKNRAWIIRSVGLPKFPYLGENNFGLYICKGTWISGHNL